MANRDFRDERLYRRGRRPELGAARFRAYGRGLTGEPDLGYGPASMRGHGDYGGSTSAIVPPDYEYAAAGYRGRGPRGYQRSDERIREDVCEHLTDDPQLDASDMEVSVASGEVTLSGLVSSREDKHRAEDLTDTVAGVKDVHNRLRVSPG